MLPQRQWQRRNEAIAPRSKSRRFTLFAILGGTAAVLVLVYIVLALTVSPPEGQHQRHGAHGLVKEVGKGSQSHRASSPSSKSGNPMIDHRIQQALDLVRNGPLNVDARAIPTNMTRICSLPTKSFTRQCQQVDASDSNTQDEEKGVGRGFVALQSSGALFLQYLLVQMEHLRTDGRSWSYDTLNGFPTVQVLDDHSRYRTTSGREEAREEGSAFHKLRRLWYGHVSRLRDISYPFDSMTRVGPSDYLRYREQIDSPRWCKKVDKQRKTAMVEHGLDWKRQGFGRKPTWWDSFVDQKLSELNLGPDSDDSVVRQCSSLSSGPTDEILGFLNGTRANVRSKCPGWTTGDGCRGCKDWRLTVLVRDPRDMVLSMFETVRGPVSSFSLDLNACPWLGSANAVQYAGSARDLCEL